MSIKRFNPTCAAGGFGVVVYSLVRHTRVNLGVRRTESESDWCDLPAALTFGRMVSCAFAMKRSDAPCTIPFLASRLIKSIGHMKSISVLQHTLPLSVRLGTNSFAMAQTMHFGCPRVSTGDSPATESGSTSPITPTNQRRSRFNNSWKV